MILLQRFLVGSTSWPRGASYATVRPLLILGLWLVAVALHTWSISIYGLGFVGGMGFTVCCKRFWFCCQALNLPKAGSTQVGLLSLELAQSWIYSGWFCCQDFDLLSLGSAAKKWTCSILRIFQVVVNIKLISLPKVEVAQADMQVAVKGGGDQKIGLAQVGLAVKLGLANKLCEHNLAVKVYSNWAFVVLLGLAVILCWHNFFVVNLCSNWAFAAADASGTTTGLLLHSNMIQTKSRKKAIKAPHTVPNISAARILKRQSCFFRIWQSLSLHRVSLRIQLLRMHPMGNMPQVIAP
ncbi:hypothetical protein U1Q18_040107 [Sarracenia purpurea var. burkii]